MAKAIWLVHTNPKDGSEDEYNDWYDNTHVKDLLQVPGITSATRYEMLDPADGALRYVAVYEIEADDPAAVLVEVRARQSDGRATMTETIDRENPPPVTALYLAR